MNRKTNLLKTILIIIAFTFGNGILFIQSLINTNGLAVIALVMVVITILNFFHDFFLVDITENELENRREAQGNPIEMITINDSVDNSRKNKKSKKRKNKNQQEIQPVLNREEEESLVVRTSSITANEASNAVFNIENLAEYNSVDFNVVSNNNETNTNENVEEANIDLIDLSRSQKSWFWNLLIGCETYITNMAASSLFIGKISRTYAKIISYYFRIQNEWVINGMSLGFGAIATSLLMLVHFKKPKVFMVLAPIIPVIAMSYIGVYTISTTLLNGLGNVQEYYNNNENTWTFNFFKFCDALNIINFMKHNQYLIPRAYSNLENRSVMRGTLAFGISSVIISLGYLSIGRYSATFLGGNLYEDMIERLSDFSNPSVQELYAKNSAIYASSLFLIFAMPFSWFITSFYASYEGFERMIRGYNNNGSRMNLKTFLKLAAHSVFSLLVSAIPNKIFNWNSLSAIAGLVTATAITNFFSSIVTFSTTSFKKKPFLKVLSLIFVITSIILFGLVSIGTVYRGSLSFFAGSESISNNQTLAIE